MSNVEKLQLLVRSSRKRVSRDNENCVPGLLKLLADCGDFTTQTTILETIVRYPHSFFYLFFIIYIHYTYNVGDQFCGN